MRIRMRYVALFALAATAAVALVGIATAAPNGNSSSLKGSKFIPSKLPKNSFKSGALFVHTHANYAHPGGIGGATDRAQLFFDDDGKLDTSGVPTCTENRIQGKNMKAAMAACGSAKVGTGKAQASGGINGCVLVFNGKPSNGRPTDLVYTRAKVPGTFSCAHPSSNTGGDVTVILNGVVKPNPASLGGDFSGGKELDVQHINSASPFPLTDFQVTTKRGNYISARCHDSNHKLNIKGKFTYTDGQSDTVSSSQTCTVAP
jgi:hypothetical protein